MYEQAYPIERDLATKRDIAELPLALGATAVVVHKQLFEAGGDKIAISGVLNELLDTFRSPS